MATVPVFRTWVAGEVVTAAYFNSNVRDAGNFFLSTPVAELRQTVAQSMTNNSTLPVVFDTEDIDTDNGHSTVTNTSRYTVQTAGRFQFSGGCSFAANATGVRTVVWEVNGSIVSGTTHQQAATATTAQRLPAPTYTAPLSVGSFGELAYFQTSGGALNTDASGGGQPRMSVRWVGTT